MSSVIDSLLIQKKLPFEICVSDNCSADVTGSVFGGYGSLARVVFPPLICLWSRTRISLLITCLAT